jgi:hypothetical protein
MLKIDGGSSNMADPLHEDRGMPFDQSELHMQAHWCSINEVNSKLTNIIIRRNIYEMSLKTRDAINEVVDYCFKNMKGIKDELHYNALKREADREGKTGRQRARLMERGQ